jgi:hypothetical protein
VVSGGRGHELVHEEPLLPMAAQARCRGRLVLELDTW